MAAKKEMSVFETLNKINVNEHTEHKNGLTYLSWAWAWSEVKKAYPEATYKIYEDAAGKFYHTDGRTGWVKTGVSIEGIECIEYLPIMDYRNKSIPADSITSFDVNKAIQRSLTKACARHGLGLYIYAGEDLPEEECGSYVAKQREEVTPRTKVLFYCNAHGIALEDVAEQYDFHGSHTDQEYEELLEKLKKDVEG